MAIAEHASSPAVVDASGPGASVTTASFSPPAGSLVVAMVASGWDNVGTSTISISDSSGGGSWSDVTEVEMSTGDRGASAVGVKYFASAPGSITVTASFTNNEGGRYLAVKVLTGAASNQSGAASVTRAYPVRPGDTTTDRTENITVSEGSAVYGTLHNNYGDYSFTMNGNTTLINKGGNGSDFVSYASVRSTDLSLSAGTVEIGGTTNSTTGSVAIREILAEAPEDTLTAVAPAVTADFSGRVTGIQYRSSDFTSATTNSDTTFTVPKPSGVQEGDLMIAVFTGDMTNFGSPTFSLSGWTEADRALVGANQWLGLAVFYRFAESGDPSSWNGSISGHTFDDHVVGVVAYSGVDETTPFIDQEASYELSAANTCLTSTLTNTNEDAWVVTAFAERVVNDTTKAMTSTDTERIDQDTGDSSGDNSVLAIYDSNGPIATGSVNRTGTASGYNSTANEMYSWIGLLNPAVDAATAEIDANAPAATAEFEGTRQIPAATLDAEAPAVVAELDGEKGATSGTLDAEAPAATAELEGTRAATSGSMDAEAPAAQASVDALSGDPATGTLGAEAPAVTADLDGVSGNITAGAVSAVAPAAEAEVTAFHGTPIDADLDTVAPAAQGSLDGLSGDPATGTLGAEAPAVTAALSGTTTTPTTGPMEAEAPAATASLDGLSGTAAEGVLDAEAPAVTGGFGGSATAAIEFVASNTASNLSGSTAVTLDVSTPVGTEEGDLIVAAIYKAPNSISTLTVPSGWTIIDSAVDTTNIHATMYYRVAEADEPSVHSFQVSDDSIWGVCLATFRNVDPDDPILIADSASYGSTDPATAPSVTTSESSVILTFMASRDDTTTEVTFSSADAGTEIAQWGFDGGLGTRNGALYYSATVPAGTYAYTVNPTGSVTNSVMFTVALQQDTPPIEGSAEFTAPAVTSYMEGTSTLELTVDAEAPTATASFAGAIPTEGELEAAVLAVQFASRGGSPVEGDFAGTAPTVRVLFGIETRVFGERVVHIEEEDRTTYVPYETLRLTKVAAEDRTTTVPQDKPAERFEV